ncbi:MAG TPA: glycosyltransferase family 1 protein [Micropepsaceae bacterium]|nr:glycosyltransferase family 1 protein [Micropepsaceae bacterium]
MGADRLKLLIVTDAWKPQVNGVVRTLEYLGRELTDMGHQVRFATPEGHPTLPLPTYPEIRVALFPRTRLLKRIEEFSPDAIHVATEGPLGMAARAICRRKAWRFTTSFHTRFPQYVHARFPVIPEPPVYAVLRRFHGAAAVTMVATPSIKRDLETHGFSNLALWSRGVDIQLFSPGRRIAATAFLPEAPRPLFLYVGRVAVEKNVEAFLELDLPGTKLIVGEGPQRPELQARFAQARFLGQKTGDELATIYASSDVFVFPSRTDTFGLVLLEALASGTPVAAYPVSGPLDVVGTAGIGALAEDLGQAALQAVAIPRHSCRRFAEANSWRASAEQFTTNLALTR